MLMPLMLLVLLLIHCFADSAASDNAVDSCPVGADGDTCRTGVQTRMYDWKAIEGCAIPSGSDIGDAQWLTIQEAKTHCGGIDNCKGFTFEGNDPLGSLSGSAVWMHFKGHFDCIDAEWIAYRRMTRKSHEPVAYTAPAPPPPPPQPAVSPAPDPPQPAAASARDPAASPPRFSAEKRALLSDLGAKASQAKASQANASSTKESRAVADGVALCLTGQVRMLHVTTGALVQNVLEVLNPEVFMYGPQDPFAPGGEPDLPQELLEYVVEARWEDEDVRKHLYETEDAGRVNDFEYAQVQGNWFGNQCVSPPLSDNRPGSALCFYYNQLKCAEMVRDREEDRGTPFAWVMLTRTDFRWLAPHPSLDLLRSFEPYDGEQSVWIPSGSDWEGGLNDRHALIPRKYMESYMSGWNLIIDGKAKDVMLETLGPMKVMGYPGPNTENYLRARLQHANVPVERFPSVAYLTCTQKIKSRWTQCSGTPGDAPGWLYKEEMEHATRIAQCVKSAWTNEKMEECAEDISHLYRPTR